MVNREAFAFALLAVMGVSLIAYAQEIEVGEYDFSAVLATPHPYPSSLDGAPTLVWQDRYSYPGASYIVFHMSRFDLAPGDTVIITDPEQKVIHTYKDQGFLPSGSFFTLSVPGDTAIIRLYSHNKDGRAFGYEVDFVARGYSDEELDKRYNDPPSVCGNIDWRDAICYRENYPTEYQISRAGVKLLVAGRSLCSGWLVSCQNHILTNSHCVSTQARLDTVEVQFMYQRPACDGGEAVPELQLQGGRFLRTSRDYDYTLFIPNLEDSNPQATYGFIRIDPTTPDLGDRMYIIGHPRGQPKKISLESSHPADEGGVCRIQSIEVSRCVGIVPEIGYYCDTAGGSSGSVVVSGVSHQAIALHNCGGCPNRGVPIIEVYQDVQKSNTPLPECSIGTE